MLQRAESAILVVDMLNDFVIQSAPMQVAGALATVPAIAAFLDHGRKSQWAVIYINRLHRASGIDAEMTRRHLFAEGKPFCVPGTPGAEVVEALKPKPEDLIVIKQRFSAFLGTDLDLILRGLGARRIFVTGTQYPNCIRATAVDSMALDYETIVCTDCCSAATPEVAEANVFDLLNMGIVCAPSTKFMAKALFYQTVDN